MIATSVIASRTSPRSMRMTLASARPTARRLSRWSCPSIGLAMAAVNESAQLEALLRPQQDHALETDIDKVLGRIVQTARETLSTERATLFVIDNGRSELWSRVLTEGTEPGATEVREIRLPLDGQSLAAEVARTGAILRIDAPYDDPRFDPSTDHRTGFRTRSILVAPI